MKWTFAPHRIPRRFRGLVALFTLIFFILLLRLLWGWYADRQVQALLDEYRRRGLPVSAGDLKFPDVPDSENAWLVQLKAANASFTGTDSPRTSPLDYPGYPPYPPAWTTLAAASEAAHAPVFAQLRQARKLQRVQIHQALPSPLAAALLPYINNMRHLANLTCDGAIYAHLQDNDAEALERALDVLHLARSLQHDPFLVSQLVGLGCEMSACNTAMTIAPGLRFDPAARQSAQALIARLLDEASAKQGLRACMDSERLLHIDTARQQSQNLWALGPLADREIVRNGPNFDLAAQATLTPTWPQAKALLSRAKWDRATGNRFLGGPVPGSIPRYSRWFNQHSFDMSPAVERHFRGIAERRITAVSLACQIYRADHRKFPDRLEQLVPKYLPAVPLDPFHDDGRTIGYAVPKHEKPEKGDRPVLYFDPGYAEYPIPHEPTYSWYVDQRVGPRRQTTVRQYRDLMRFAP